MSQADVYVEVKLMQGNKRSSQWSSASHSLLLTPGMARPVSLTLAGPPPNTLHSCQVHLPPLLIHRQVVLGTRSSSLVAGVWAPEGWAVPCSSDLCPGWCSVCGILVVYAPPVTLLSNRSSLARFSFRSLEPGLRRRALW